MKIATEKGAWILVLSVVTCIMCSVFFGKFTLADKVTLSRVFAFFVTVPMLLPKKVIDQLLVFRGFSKYLVTGLGIGPVLFSLFLTLNYSFSHSPEIIECRVVNSDVSFIGIEYNFQQNEFADYREMRTFDLQDKPQRMLGAYGVVYEVEQGLFTWEIVKRRELVFIK
jgi:hypothetical protein